jgi:hypothetical protein
MTFTVGGTWAAADTLTVTINGKSVTFTCTTTTAASATAGILAALQAATTITEFTEATFATLTSTTFTATGVTAGNNITITVSRVTANSGSFSVATTTAATGPNRWDDANNWDNGIPANGDTANVNLSLGSVLDGLDQSAVTVASLNIYTTSATSNTMGLPRINASNYTEYREQSLKIGATAWVIDSESPRVKINFGSVQFGGEVRRTGSAQDAPTPAVLLQGTSTSNTLDVVSGTVGFAYYYGESGAASAITVGPNGNLILGAGVSTATTVTSLGTLVSNGVFTTLYTVGGVTTVKGTPGATTIDVSGGTLYAQMSGTTTNVLVGPGTLDATNDVTARTFTNTTIRPGGIINDLPQPTITYTNKVTRASGVTVLQAA